jgi:hypothetical protein
MKRKRVALDDIQPLAQVQTLSQTPRKEQKHDSFATPLKPFGRLQAQDSPPTPPRLFSPSQHKSSSSPYMFRTSIGPTPQRDGKVLGLFDLLSQSGGSAKSATRGGIEPSNVMASADEVLQTPSKRNPAGELANGPLLDLPVEEEDNLRARRHSRTPASNGKRFLFSTFFKTPKAFKITPVKPPVASLDPDDIPLQSSGQPSETPTSLRRSNAQLVPAIASVDELGELSPVAVRMPPKLVGRGLSTLVQGLRDMEEEQMEDELDVLREMEQEELGGLKPAGVGKVLIKDSQTDPFMRLKRLEGPDLGVGFENIVEEGLGKDGAGEEEQPAKVWKKKGLKRQTRRIVMKPRARVKAVAETKETTEGKDVAPHQQIPSHQDSVNKDPQNEDVSDEDDYHDLDSEVELSQPKTQDPCTGKPAKKKPKKPEKPQTNTKQAKKHNPNAHANYRALKIKNKNSKAKGRGRFGRRGR